MTILILQISGLVYPSSLFLWQWCTYAVAFTTFHCLEFGATALANPDTLSADSFLINHSTSYTAAALLSWGEFILRYITSYNVPRWYSQIGLLLLLPAQTLRTMAMITAGVSFNHIIQIQQRESHTLVTRGVYAFWRHPAYTGFFYWSIAMQMVLGNFINAIGAGTAAWMFFSKRIPYEEETLQRQYPDEYPRYRDRTWVGIPFLSTTTNTAHSQNTAGDSTRSFAPTSSGNNRATKRNLKCS